MRSGRGSQLLSWILVRLARGHRWRPSSGMAEDRNVGTGFPSRVEFFDWWRPSSEMAEDRNIAFHNLPTDVTNWRPSSRTRTPRSDLGRAAVVLV